MPLNVFFNRVKQIGSDTTVSEQPLMRMARRSTAELLGVNVKESLIRCKPEDLEYYLSKYLLIFMFENLGV